jgi:hypothetical protein
MTSQHLCALPDLLVQTMGAAAMQPVEQNADIEGEMAQTKLIFDTVPSDPNRDEYRQVNTIEATFQH